MTRHGRHPDDWPAVRAAAAYSVFAVCFLLYARTLTPGLSASEGDSHELTMAAATLGLPHPSGYPLYTWLAFLFTWFPIGEVAYRTNLLSATLAAGAAGLLVSVGGRVGLQLAPAAFAGLVFGMSSTLWSQAVITEVYAPNAFAVVGVLALLLAWARDPARERCFVAFACACGLSLGMHLSNLSLAPAYALFAVLSDKRLLRRRRMLALAALAFVAGLVQFAWLPLRAETARFPNPAPDTWPTFFDYTLGWVTSGHFTVPLAAMPGRLVLYQRLVVENFTAPGVALGCLGMWRLAWTAPRAFWLLFGLYATNVVLAARVGMPDSEVFFIPSHAMFALFMAFGAEAVAAAVRRLHAGRALPRTLAAVGTAALFAVLVPFAALGIARADRSRDTAVGDFLAAALAAVPAGSELVAGRGAFGQDIAYWRRFRGGRTDVRLASVEAPLPASDPSPRFVKARLVGSRLDTPARWGLAPAALPPDPWAVATVAGIHPDLVLYRVLTVPPPPPDSAVAHRLDRRVGSDTFVGYTLAPEATPDRRVRLRTVWSGEGQTPPVVMPRIGGVRFAAHEVGRGNWRRAARDGATSPFVEEVDLVAPSFLAPGPHLVELGIVDLGPGGPSVEWIPLGSVRLD